MCLRSYTYATALDAFSRQFWRHCCEVLYNRGHLHRLQASDSSTVLRYSQSIQRHPAISQATSVFTPIFSPSAKQFIERGRQTSSTRLLTRQLGARQSIMTAEQRRWRWRSIRRLLATRRDTAISSSSEVAITLDARDNFNFQFGSRPHLGAQLSAHGTSYRSSARSVTHSAGLQTLRGVQQGDILSPPIVAAFVDDTIFSVSPISLVPRPLRRATPHNRRRPHERGVPSVRASRH